MTSGALWELLDLVARWVHVVAAIMWVGNSLLFNWIDRTLQPATRRGTGAVGETWLLHSGGFYFVEKTQLVGEPLPRPLHWFKWQAYTTWVSGVVLLVAVYWAGGRAAMEDPAVAALSHRSAVLIGAGTVFGGVAGYELLQRTLAPRAPRLTSALLAGAFVAATYALLHLLAGRAAFLHLGAMLASIMAANVAMTIIPSQRALVLSVADGQGADAVLAARAKRVSVYNNYITFPVVALMVSSHFPALYSHRWSWLLVVILVAGGAAVRHALNLRFTTPRWRTLLAGAVGVTLAALVLVLHLPARAAPPVRAALPTAPVTFADARHVIDRRCAVCHSAQPADSSVGAAPAGVMFDHPAQIQRWAPRIRERAVVTRTMPPANRTRITDAERAILAAWIDRGAPGP